MVGVPPTSPLQKNAFVASKVGANFEIPHIPHIPPCDSFCINVKTLTDLNKLELHEIIPHGLNTID